MVQPIPTPAELTAMMQWKRAFLRRRNLALSPDERRAKFRERQGQAMTGRV